jgi:amino acid permease
MGYMNMNPKKILVITLVVYILNIGISMIPYNIGIIIEAIGSTAFPFVFFVIPGFLYHSLAKS